MKSNVKYEYEVTAIAPDGYPVDITTDTRQSAREIKKDFKKLYDCTKAKIIQNVYELKDSKQVR